MEVAEKALEFCAAFPLHGDDRVTVWTKTQVERLYEMLDAALTRFVIEADAEGEGEEEF